MGQRPKAAMATGDIDAAFGWTEYLSLRDQGLARLLYATGETDVYAYRNCSFIGDEAFIRKYPEITQRVVKTVVLAAKWLSDQDANPAPAFQLWTRSGVTFANFKEDLGKSSLKVLSSPLVDEFLTSQYNRNIQEAKRFGLIRNTFRFEDWYEPQFLQQVFEGAQPARILGRVRRRRQAKDQDLTGNEQYSSRRGAREGRRFPRSCATRASGANRSAQMASDFSHMRAQ